MMTRAGLELSTVLKAALPRKLQLQKVKTFGCPKSSAIQKSQESYCRGNRSINRFCPQLTKKGGTFMLEKQWQDSKQPIHIHQATHPS